jgi:hypothetical protein
MRAQLARDQQAHTPCFRQGRCRVTLPQFTQRPHRRYRGEPFSKALHTPAFVIDADRSEGVRSSRICAVSASSCAVFS